MDFGRIRFYSARASGIEISQLGSGTYSHLGFFGAGGHLTAVNAGSYQDTTIIVDFEGVPQVTTFGGSSYLTNNKNVGASTVRISGTPLGPMTVPINTVNIFQVENLAIEPRFLRIPSGTLLIKYESSGNTPVHTFNAKIYAYDNTATIVDPPTDVTVVGFEINASGLWKNASHSGVWKTLNGRDNALEFVNHSSVNGYVARPIHYWVASISARADSVGVLDNFNFAFQMQFV